MTSAKRAGAASVVYFAEDGGDVNASDAYEPTCAAGCGLSGDGTQGLPATLSGANAPLNPVDYADITPTAC